MSKTLYKIYVGKSTQKIKANPIIWEQRFNEALNKFIRIQSMFHGGCSVSECTGHWITENGEHIQEQAVCIEIVTNNKLCVNDIEQLKQETLQDCILLTKHILDDVIFI